MTHLDQPTSAGQHLRRFDDLYLSAERQHPASSGQRAIALRINPRAVAVAQFEQAAGQGMLRLWCLFGLLVLALWSSGRVWGQEYKKEPLPAVPKATVTAMERAKSEGLTKPDLSPQWASYDDFRKYYVYLFAKLKDPAYSAEYGKIMQSMLDDVERSQRARTPAAGVVSGWIVAGASAIAADNYHPAARVNAALLLALIDEQGADMRAGRPPVPARSALVPLIRLYNTGTNPDGVRAAALQGLARHVNLGSVPAQYRSGIANLMLQLAQSDPPAPRSPEAHAYMQRYAVDILTVLANPNTSEPTAQTLVSLSTAKEKPSLIAAYAASKLGQLRPGQAKVNQPSKVLNSWAVRAAETIDRELDRLAKLDPPKAVRDQPAMPTERTRAPRGGMYGGYDEGGAGMDEMDPTMMYGDAMDTMDMMDDGGAGMEGMYMEGYGMGGMTPQAKPQPVEIIASRRRINHVLQQLQVGVTGRLVTGKPNRPAGLLIAATESDQAAFDQWIKAISEVVTAINVDTLDDRVKFVDALKEQSAALKGLAGIEVEPEDTVPLPTDPLAGQAVGVPGDAGPVGPVGGPDDPAAGGPAAGAAATGPGNAAAGPGPVGPGAVPPPADANGQPPAVSGPADASQPPPIVPGAGGPNGGDGVEAGEDLEPNEALGADL